MEPVIPGPSPGTPSAILGLGLGAREIALGSSFGLDFSVKGRYASFSKVSDPNANSIDGTGPSSLGMDTTSGVTVLVPITDAGIAANPGTARDAVVDYSGIDAKVAFDN